MEEKVSTERSSESHGLQHGASRPRPTVGNEDNLNAHVWKELMRKFHDAISTSGISKTMEQEIKILKHEIKEQHTCLKQYQLILASVKDVIKEKKMSATTSEKVTNILAIEGDEHFFQTCPINTFPLELFEDIASSKAHKLCLMEKALLHTAVEESIVEKCNFMKSNEDYESASSSIDRSNLLKLNTQLDEAVLKYNESLVQGCKLLENICLSYEVPISKINRNLAECLIEDLRETELKANILESETNNKIYMEDENVEKAVNKIDASLKLEMESVSHELKKLRALNSKYDCLKEMKEYKNMVMEYGEVKKSVEDKKRIVKQCESLVMLNV